MKVKKFRAPTMPEVMKKIRAELGSDAVILNSKVVEKGGFLGFFTKKNIEVIAGIDSMISNEPILQAPKPKQKVIPERNINPSLVRSENDHRVVKEIEELKTLMKQLSTTMNTGFEQYPEPIREIHSILTEQELDNSIRKELVNTLLEKWFLHGANATKEEVLKWLKEEMVLKLSQIQFGGISYRKKYINVVGPTGVGKTTTLAKIAAECVLRDQKKVAFITTDTYRIAAIEQLKTYASILNIPIEVCYTIDDFRLAKEKFQEFDLVLVDTAGRNFRNQEYVEDLKEILDFDEEMETYLVLALVSKCTDMKTIFNQFSLVDIHKIIFTKMDETSNYGAILNMVLSFNVGVAYLTNGQNVPDDIIKATPKLIVDTVLGVNKDA